MRRECDMNRRFPAVALTAALGFVMLQAQGQAPPANADPYANNPDAGKLQFPLAAPAGKDSGAITTAPAGAVNQGILDPTKWKYGPAFNAPANSKIWNPVKIKMMKGEKVTGGTVFSTDSPETYCAMANAGYDFIWTKCSMTRAIGARSPRCGSPARMPRRSPACASPTPMSARSSTPWTPARWCWWCRRC